MTPEQAKIQRELDESATLLTSSMPPLYWGLYQGYIKEGFTEAQAFELIKVHLSASVSGASSI
jgi:hypothetical protein